MKQYINLSKVKKKKKRINITHLYDYWVEVYISIIHFYLSFMYIKSNMYYSNIFTLHYTGNKFLQSGLQENEYNKNISLNHTTLKHAVHYVTL